MSEFGFWHWIIVGAILLFLFRPLIGGFLSGLRDEPSSPETPLAGAISFSTAVVGEANYQANLLAICGTRAPDGVEKYFKAQLILEDANPYDPKAVRVDIDSLTVGYLSREMARTWRAKHGAASTFTCNAVVRGGWDRGPNNQGSFGVWLDLPS